MSLFPIISPFAAKPVTAILVATGLSHVTNGNPHTYSSVSLGTSTDDRIVVCLVYMNGWSGGSTHTLSSATIDGNAATIHVDEGSSSDIHNGASIISYALGAGNTSGDITITRTASLDESCVYIYDVKNANSTPTATVFDEDGGTVNAVTGVITIPAGGMCLAAHICANSRTTSWAADGGMTETKDEVIMYNGIASSAAESFPAAEESSITVSATPSASSSTRVLVAGAWEPA
jgi:hypothetical protein